MIYDLIVKQWLGERRAKCAWLRVRNARNFRGESGENRPNSQQERNEVRGISSEHERQHFLTHRVSPDFGGFSANKPCFPFLIFF
jgi:hypothetical protein